MEFIPLLFGALFFAVCFMTALYRLGQPKSRMSALVIGLVGLIGLLPFLAGIPPLNPTLANLSGTYRGQYGTFVLFPNGTFKQRYIDQTGHAYSTAGKWKLDDDGVDFSNMLLPVGTANGIEKPQLDSGYRGAALLAFGNSISFDEDEGIQINRVSRSLEALQNIPAAPPTAAHASPPQLKQTTTIIKAPITAARNY